MRRLLLAIFPGMVLFATVSPVHAANPEHLQRLLKTNQCPNCDLSNADLKDVNLFGANLVNANLKGAMLQGANLGSANFSDADLSGANLERAYLDRATLESANLTQANLSEAYLKNATTTGMQLNGANLRGAKLQNVDLVGVNLQGADLSGANLSGVTLSGFRVNQGATRSMFGFATTPGVLANFICQESSFPGFSAGAEELRRYGVEFIPTNLSGATLTNANLTNAILFRGNLTNANFTGANLKGSCLVEANLKGAILDRADLELATLRRAVLEGASLKETQNAILTDAFQTEADARQQELEKQIVPQVRMMMADQRRHFRQNKQFATRLEDLNLMTAETEQYAYRVFSQGDRTRLSVVAAVPKVGGLKTYIGLVNSSGNPKQQNVFMRLCVSQEAKPMLPKLPLEVPNNQSTACPTGFQARQ